MPIDRDRRVGIVRSLALSSVLWVISGCVQLGIRPSMPELTTDPCAELRSQVQYAQDLHDAYHSRASLNRFSIYAAGILALGTAAATGGLGAAGVAAITLTYLSISGGFASGAFAIVDNEALADVYTVYAGRIADGLKVARPLATDTDARVCQPALTALVAAVTSAENDLERARTDKAWLAATHAQEQLNRLRTALATTTTTPTTTTTTTKTTTPP